MRRNLVLPCLAIPFALSTLALAAPLLSGCDGITPPTGDLLGCVDAGGICLPEGTCAASGGTVTNGCYSDQGPSECCMAAPPKAGATSCAGQGGLCLSISECWPGLGYLAASSDDCSGDAVACCVPHAVCGDATIQCCAGWGDGYTYPPACDHGKIVCTNGYEDALGKMCR